MPLPGCSRQPAHNSCSYLPGQRQLPIALLFLAAGFFAFVSVGGGLVAWSVRHPLRSVLAPGVFVTAVAWARHRRLRTRELESLQFDDEPLDSIQALGLRPYA